MFGNYFKIAVRNLLRNRAFTSINILGLSLGLTCCILIMLYIRHELSYDRHHPHAGDLYLVRAENKIGNGAETGFAHLSAPYAFALKAEFPEVWQAARLYVNLIDDKALLQVREGNRAIRSFYQTGGYQVDSTFFDLFAYEFTEGNPRKALGDPDAIVLSEAVARKLFGNEPALNKIIRVGGSTGSSAHFRVSGVFRTPDNPSHIDARFFVSLQAGWIGKFLREHPLDLASNNMFYTYLRLAPGTDPGRLQRKLPAFVDKYARADLKAMGARRKLYLLGVPDIHLYEGLDTIVTPTSSRAYIYILASIALFTLLIACVNFMNLSTAQSAKRAAEVGIRKVLGAERGALVRQFLGESLVLSLLALAASFGLVSLLLPLFNYLSGKSFPLAAVFDPFAVGIFLGLTLVAGLLAGSYPALFLSGFNPAQVLKGKFVNSLSAVSLRKGLVVFQFFIAVCLMLATFIIEAQMQFLKNKPLGFAKEQQVVIPLRSEGAKAAYTAYRNEILRNNLVTSAAGVDYYPGIRNASDFVLHTPGQTRNEGVRVYSTWVDYDYLQTMDFKLARGRFFSRQFPGDTSTRVIVNEAALQQLGIAPERAVGQVVQTVWQDSIYRYQIVGVVKNFHFKSLHQPIEPYLFQLSGEPNFNYLVANVNMTNIGEVLPFLARQWKALRPDEPFEYSFLDQDFQKNYQAEE
ncbi:MAG TPA: ABC transporter permease, partial [Cytophagales bacterium]